MFSFPSFESVHCSMSGSSCCFFTYIQVSQEADKMSSIPISLRVFQIYCDPYSQRLYVVNETEKDVFFWNSFAFPIIQWMLAIWFLVSLPFLNPFCTTESLYYLINISPYRNTLYQVQERKMAFWNSSWQGLKVRLWEISKFQIELDT